MLPTTPTAEISRSASIVWVLPSAVSTVAVTRIVALLDLRHLGAGEDPDALLLEALAGERGDLLVLDGQDLRQHLDDRHLGAHRAVERGELDADGARADDEQRFRHGLAAPSPRNRSRSASRPARCRAARAGARRWR